MAQPLWVDRSLNASGASAGARDEVLRSRGQKLDFRTLQIAQPRREAANGEPLAQHANRGLVLGTGEALRCSLQAGIAEEPMDDFAEHLAESEIGDKSSVALGGSGLRHAPRGLVAVRQVAGQRDIARV